MRPSHPPRFVNREPWPPGQACRETVCPLVHGTSRAQAWLTRRREVGGDKGTAALRVADLVSRAGRQQRGPSLMPQQLVAAMAKLPCVLYIRPCEPNAPLVVAGDYD
eukprot:scaffold3695_cov398-Prasinococcus_capsulatus_cf.AAC.5